MIIRVDFLIGNRKGWLLSNYYTCTSGKRSFESEQLAEEALIQNHIRNEYRAGQGPINIYECDECGCWHFTSKGMKHDLFNDEEVIHRINAERRAFHWEQGFKGR